MEDGRFRLEDFELYKVAREFRKRAYRLLKQLPPEEKVCFSRPDATRGGFRPIYYC